MNYTKFVSSLFLSFFLAIGLSSLSLSAGLPNDNMGMPSQEELLEMQKQMEEQINAYVSTLSEEQQIQFYKEVEEETRKMEAMSEDELNAHIQEMLDEIEKAQTELPQPEEPVVVTPAKPEPVIVVEEKLNEIDQALKVINNIQTRTERFLRQADRMPELPGKIDKWVSNDQVKEWQIDLTWEMLKAKIELLNKKIIQLKEKDPKTNKYRYIQYLLNKEDVYKNLVTLSENLTKYEQDIEVPEFGLGVVKKEVRVLIQKILGSFAQAIYTLELPENIDKIIVEFDPRAKELRDEEEAARKKAVEESKKGPKESPRKEVGGSSKQRGSSEDKDYSGGYDQPYYPRGGSGGYVDPYDNKNNRFDEKKPEKSDVSGDKNQTPKEVAPKADKAETQSKEMKAIISFLEAALVSIEEVIDSSGEDTIKKYISSISKEKENEATKKKVSGSRKDASGEIRSAATNLRKAKRKTDSLINRKEKDDVLKRIRSTRELNEVTSEMNGRTITEDSSEELQAFKALANAINSFNR